MRELHVLYALGALAVAAGVVYYLDQRRPVVSGPVSLTTAAAAAQGAFGIFSPLLPLSLNPTAAQLLRDKPIKV